MQSIQSYSSLIKELRERLQLSQESLAQQLGVSFQTVSRWERGLAKPSRLALKVLQDRVEAMGERGSDLLTYFS
ncbi:helix-turn-helix domain-containing protein [Spirulina sp. CS-785/01]|uniref:helix-turn-helix domain-containing protein n=1 Tax=Spirulina sp. CS-785/01 TaxID=3021716 RepID=UPI00232DD701|nr:helix-turn-helix domain-containing protein [Spirulina sp. CS-785/01]MDB9315609.1 helix-turn-helix domain-containing protein [Spirulina sp. CS-785/01]